ncbi:hypothetical protein J6590_080132 [Homalodisca vitripennis]|nr:hypothetical protein J6590_080132 [Homalodisca vitripennis]
MKPWRNLKPRFPSTKRCFGRCAVSGLVSRPSIVSPTDPGPRVALQFQSARTWEWAMGICPRAAAAVLDPRPSKLGGCRFLVFVNRAPSEGGFGGNQLELRGSLTTEEMPRNPTGVLSTRRIILIDQSCAITDAGLRHYGPPPSSPLCSLLCVRVGQADSDRATSQRQIMVQYPVVTGAISAYVLSIATISCTHWCDRGLVRIAVLTTMGGGYHL